MRCQDFRASVGAEPGSHRDEIEAHAAGCPECAAFRREMRELDRAVLAALRAEPRAGDRAPTIKLAPARLPVWSRAAGILVAIALATAVWLAGTRTTFADEVVAHVKAEPGSLLRSLEIVPATDVSGVLSRAGLQLRPNALRISYAHGCWFRGHFAPHLVAQTDAGPVTVLILPDEPTPERPTRIRAGGFEGVAVPAPRGMLVFLGTGPPVDRVVQQVLAALSYSV